MEETTGNIRQLHERSFSRRGSGRFYSTSFPNDEGGPLASVSGPNKAIRASLELEPPDRLALERLDGSKC